MRVLINKRTGNLWIQRTERGAIWRTEKVTTGLFKGCIVTPKLYYYTRKWQIDFKYLGEL